MSSPKCQSTELVADLREEPVPTGVDSRFSSRFFAVFAPRRGGTKLRLQVRRAAISMKIRRKGKAPRTASEATAAPLGKPPQARRSASRRPWRPASPCLPGRWAKSRRAAETTQGESPASPKSPRDLTWFGLIGRSESCDNESQHCDNESQHSFLDKKSQFLNFSSYLSPGVYAQVHGDPEQEGSRRSDRSGPLWSVSQRARVAQGDPRRSNCA
jgi:hypothetical protein